MAASGIIRLPAAALRTFAAGTGVPFMRMSIMAVPAFGMMPVKMVAAVVSFVPETKHF
jgi:hypothetical protein